jgi:ADP-ribose pyrophosphatase YjhB (NUDIX family)
MFYDLLKMCVSIFLNMLNIVMGGKLPPMGSAAIIVEEKGRYLVVELPRKRVVFPGGFMVWRENPAQAAVREGKEETGFDLAVDGFVTFYAGVSANWLQISSLSFVYSGHVIGGALRKSVEGKPMWLSEEELRRRMSKNTQKVLDDYKHFRVSQHAQVN